MGRWLAWVHAGNLPALPRLLFPPVVLSALAIVLLVAGAAHAAPAPEAPSPPAGLTDLQAGRLLLRAGRLEHARAFLEQAWPAGEEERIERLFLLGRIEMRLGMPQRAVERFEAILALRPGLVRVRLELARALYAAGRDGEARHHFTTTLAAELPASVEAAVEGYLRRLNVRKRWSVSLSASRLPEIERPERETVLIGGVPFRLDEDARSSSGAGWLVSAGGSFSPRLSDDLRGVLGASVATKRYRRSEWDDFSASGDIGLARLFGEGSVSGGLRFGRRWAGGERLHCSIGPWARLRRRLNDSTHVDVALGAVHRTHESRPDRDGWRVTVNPRFVHVLDGRISIEAEPTFEVIDAEAERYSSRLIGLGATVSRAFNRGFSVSLSSSAHVRRHDAPDPLFGERRADRYFRVEARVLHRSLRYRGFSPWIGYSAERNRSNIPIHEYRSGGVFAGVSRVF